MKIKVIFLYAIALGALVFILNWADYKFYIRDFKIESYLLLVALIFTGLGAWLAYSLVNSKSKKYVQSSRKLSHAISDHKEIQLSEREMEMLLGIAEGLSNQQIGEKLHISLSTVKTHNSNLFVKLDVKRRTQALSKAKELGILSHSIEESHLIR
ncbi:MAG: LuxR C-terminal-related transcriptional regulator [Bacteroidia bacterium]